MFMFPVSFPIEPLAEDNRWKHTIAIALENKYIN